MHKENLDREQFLRYARHLILPEVGMVGQQKLLHARVLVIGAGGLGSPVLLYLAAAGVGHIDIIDSDKVEISNLQRQILYASNEIGNPKALLAAQRLSNLNPDCEINHFVERFDYHNARKLIQDCDLVIDATDNFATRYLINDVCVELKKSYVYGSIFQFEGQCTIFAPHLGTPCYRCLYPEPPPEACVQNCSAGGVFGVLPGVIGSLQATEAIKLILNIGEPILGRLLVYDALSLKFREFKLRENPNCLLCKQGISQDLHGIDAEEFMYDDTGIDIDELRELLNLADNDKPILLDIREKGAYSVASLDGIIIPAAQIKDKITELEQFKMRKIVVYCHVGRQSMGVVRYLRQLGFADVCHLRGGVMNWVAQL